MKPTMTTLNPNNWSEPAYVVIMYNGKVQKVVQASYSADNILELPEDMDWSEYCITHYELGTEFIELSTDAYPEDDPGYCFYEYFEPKHPDEYSLG